MRSLTVFIGLTAAVAFLASRFRPGVWYEGLSKPSWNPPSWLFAPVWSALYLAVAIAGWLCWRHASSHPDVAVVFWGVQLVLNGCWSWLFFGMHSPGLALVDIVVLLIAIASFIVAAFPVSAVAAWLFVPYGLWVLFATALNFTIWRLNR